MVTCSRCVLNDSLPGVVITENGLCNCCINYDLQKPFYDSLRSEKTKTIYQRSLQGFRKRANGRAKILLGISGGVDSCYLAYLMHKWEVCCDYFHVDCGWDTSVAVNNIHAIIRYTGENYYTDVIHWPTIKEMQKCFLKSGLSNQDTIQDHAFFTSLYRYAIRNKYSCILTGGNFQTEGVFPAELHGNAMDSWHIKDVCKKYGFSHFDRYPLIRFSEYFIYIPFLSGIKLMRPLNYVDYNKNSAILMLSKETEWQAYAGKHGESIFTTFFQDFYLPTIHSVDKRLIHLSCLINSGQLTKSAALSQLAEKPDAWLTTVNKELVFQRLCIKEDERDFIEKSLPSKYLDYKTWDASYKVLKFFQKLLLRVSTSFRFYS